MLLTPHQVGHVGLPLVAPGPWRPRRPPVPLLAPGPGLALDTGHALPRVAPVTVTGPRLYLVTHASYVLRCFTILYKQAQSLEIGYWHSCLQ